MKSFWFKVSLQATTDPRFRFLSDKSQVLYLHLCRLRSQANGNLWIQYSDMELTEEAGLSKNSVSRARYELEMNGFIKYKSTRNKKACRYLVIDEPERNPPVVFKSYTDSDEDLPKYLRDDSI